MSNATANSPSRSLLEQWIYDTIARRGLRVKFRLRGNKLHLLIEQPVCPDRTETLLWLIPALQETNLNHLLSDDQSPIYQLQLYACEPGQRRPTWTASIYLNQLDRHLHQLAIGETVPEVIVPAEPQAAPSTRAPRQETAPPREDETAALALSNLSLAKRGEEMAIASYLSETLSHWGVGVRVSAKAVSYSPPTAVYSTDTPIQDTWTAKRLWVACEAAYSLDPGALGEPVTQKLRELEIEGYRDAIVLFQVQGETHPDWLLRVDLTPATEMLREWARWGDVEAIQRLLNRDLVAWRLEITKATLTDITLHLCTKWQTVEPPSEAGTLEFAHGSAEGTATRRDLPELDQKRIKAEVALALEAIGPQGIHAATLYGPETAPDSPGWVEWLSLPASVHTAFADSPLTLAQQEDWEAIAFLLHRLLNPDLDRYLTIGGIRLLLLPKTDPNAKGEPGDKPKILLHLMCEAAVCPDQRQTSAAVTRFLQQLKLSNLSGVRIYGRRAGQKKPLWSNGIDLLPRQRWVPEVTPEFAATSAYVDELMPPSAEPVLRPDLTPADLQTFWQEFRQQCGYRLRQLLTRSQVFVPAATEQSSRAALPGQVSYQGTAVGLIWGAIGLLLMVQGNWLLLHWLRSQPAPAEAENRSTLIAPTEPITAGEEPSPMPNSSSVGVIAADPPASPDPQASPSVRLRQAPNTNSDPFNRQGFTRPNAQGSPLPAANSPTSRPNTMPRSNTMPRQTAAPAQRAASRQNPALQLPYTVPNARLNQAAFEIQAQAASIPTFNSRQLDQKIQLYYNFLRERGTPDVLIVGSSRALRGIDPIALEQELAKVGYPDLKVFNLGINGATVQVVDLLMQQILTPEQLPRLVIWADGARAFNSGTTDITYNGIVASPAYRQRLAGTFPIPNAPGTAAQPSETSGFRFSFNTSLTEAYQQLDRWFSGQLAAVAPVYGGRDRLKHLIQEQLTALMPENADQPVPTVSLSPDQTTLQPGQPIMDLQGFLSLGIQFNPATYYQKYARVVGQYDSDYENFRIQGEQEDALQSLLGFTQARQIPVVFVNLPLTQDYLDPARMRHERSFRQYMVQQSMGDRGLTFRNLSDRWLSQLNYFSDPSHLNRYGAYAVSRTIAQDPLIPWNVTKQNPDRANSDAARP